MKTLCGQFLIHSKLKNMRRYFMKFLSSFLMGALLLLSPTTFAATETSTGAMNLEISSDAISTQGNRYYSYNFGNVRVRYSQWADFYLRNTGNGPLYVQGIYLQSGTAYRAWSECPAYLYPGQQCLTRVEFSPWYEGYETGRLRFQFAGGNIYIDLSGWGSRY
jgi:hypothetical protein